MSVWQVGLIVMSFLRRLVPQELLGSVGNWKQLYKTLNTFLALQRHECMSLNSLTRGIEVRLGAATCLSAC